MKTLTEFRDAVRKKEMSSREAVAQCVEAIQAVDPQVKAFISYDGARALEAAEQIDARLAAGEDVGPLAGVPIAVKDNLCTTFGYTTCASKILERFAAPYDAHVIERLVAAGAVIVGKTNLDEFAMGSSTENSGFFPTRNPWSLDYVPGGSSGGSAVAVAARMVPGAIGSDTGGSIRQPASFCGVTGLKPTYGRVSRYGLVAYGSSLDQIGSLTRDVRDAALLMNVIAGHDSRDSTSVDAPVPDYAAGLGRPLHGLRIGVPAEYFGEGLDADVRAVAEAAIDVYREQGAEVVDVHLPHLPYCVACYYVIATSEASSNLARYDGVHYGYRSAAADDYVDMYCRSRQEGFGAEVRRRIMLGTFALSSGYYDAYYLKALKVRTLIRRDYEQAFERCDVIAGPAAPTPAFRIGEKVDDPLAMYLLDIYTSAVNLAGIPGIVVPAGRTGAGLPVGLQLMGPYFAEDKLLRVAHEFQRHTDWHTHTPPVCAGAGAS
jgi:aspartyl-tRNA(Asn)/glutamyl-tRNA(Gln) amidotransferase subunit A